jgi:hypothetical protein
MIRDEIKAMLEELERGEIPPSHRSRVEFVQYHEISQGDVDRIFHERLKRLQGAFWYNDRPTRKSDSPGWYTTYDMQGHGSDIDEFVAPYDDPRFKVVRAAYELAQALKGTK